MADISETKPIIGSPIVKREKGRRDERREDEAPDDDRGGGASSERDVDVRISVLGLDAGLVGPEVREALGGLMAELDRERAELEQVRMRASYLEQQHDLDPVLPAGGRLALLRRVSRAAHRSEQSEMANSLLVVHVGTAHALRAERGRVLMERLMGAAVERIKPLLRETDFLAGLGGADLGLLMPLARAADAEEKAHRIAEALTAEPVEADGEAFTLRASWGVAEFREQVDPEGLLAEADADLLVRFAG
jgi:diguanylate cyclase (GGDEF)-like protein